MATCAAANKAYLSVYNKHLKQIESSEPLIALNQAIVNYVNPMSGLSLLHVACWRLNIAAVEELLTAGACPFTPSSAGRTPIYYAALMSAVNKDKAVAVMKLLIANGDTTLCDHLDIDGCTPFDVFVSSFQSAAVSNKALLF